MKGVTETTRYRTSDGQEWSNQDQAKGHEYGLQREKCERVYDTLQEIVDDHVMSSAEKTKQIMRNRQLFEQLLFIDKDDIIDIIDTLPH